MSTIDIELVKAWAKQGGVIAKDHFGNVRATLKPDRSWVTEADVAIERMIVAQIAAHYPEHGIIGEEKTREGLEREFLWAVDPIDGTNAFVEGLPMWGVSIGVLRRGVPYAGVIYLPLLDDCYWAGPNGAAYLNDQPIHIIAPRAWRSEDWIAIPSETHRLFNIDFLGKTRAFGCTIGSIAYVARGSAIAAPLWGVAIWDIAAGLALLHASGGVALTLNGQPFDLTPMLDGSALLETIVLGEESHARALLKEIHAR